METPGQVARKQLGMKSKTLSTVKDDSFYLSTGVTPLNLGISNHSKRGVEKGTIVWIRGREGGGKTFICMSLLCEAALSPHFQGYEFIYDDVERGMRMRVEKFWPPLVGRVKAPAYVKIGSPPVIHRRYSKSTLDFYGTLQKKLDAGKKVIWVEDSLDALEGSSQNKMMDGKAKDHSQMLRGLVDGLDATGSILILISQARVDLKSMWGGDISAGGRALLHYPSVTITFRKHMTLCKSVNGIKYPIGINVQAHVIKNRVEGFDRTVYFPIYNDYGIDDIAACVDYLIFVKHWSKNKEGVIDAPEFEFTGMRQELVSNIETDHQQPELRTLTAKVWHGIMAQLESKRPPRYLTTEEL